MYNGSFTDKLKFLFKLHIPPGKWEVLAFGEGCSWLLSSLHGFFPLALLFFLLSAVLATVQSNSFNTDVHFFQNYVFFEKDLICSNTISLHSDHSLHSLYKAFAFYHCFGNALKPQAHFINLFIAAFTEVESLSPSKGGDLSKEELIHFSQLSGKLQSVRLCLQNIGRNLLIISW